MPLITADYVQTCINMRSQGAAASISAGPGAIARVYAAFPSRKVPARKWAQTPKRQVNYLEDVSEYFEVRNGYVVLPRPASHSTLMALPQNEWERAALRLHAKIGYHQNVQVTTGFRAGDLLEQVTDPDQVIDQVICGAIYLDKSDIHVHPAVAERCEFALDVAYEGAYLAAIRHQKKHLFLTLVGGGAYGNKKKWIYGAIMRAHARWSNHANSCLERVTLVLPSVRDIYLPFISALQENGIPFFWVEPKVEPATHLLLGSKEDNEAWSMYDRGRRGLLGIGLERDAELGLTLIREAAALGCYWAERDLEFIQPEGTFAWKEAADAYEAHLSDPTACTNLGSCYYTGTGRAVNEFLAFKLWRKAAEGGCVNGLNAPALCYYRGHGVKQSHETAAELFAMCAARHYFISQFNMGNCLKNGDGVPCDLREAAVLFEQAARRGERRAWRNLFQVVTNAAVVPANKPTVLPAGYLVRFTDKEVKYNTVPTLYLLCLQYCSDMWRRERTRARIESLSLSSTASTASTASTSTTPTQHNK
eukprot:TRINITY_DN2827_c0_g1_i5.p1 TRINITY_DN2827_c0_g1~~TRINITY_DN2827_c0_g1_i5.p1  ORF type:complete len:534 (+),score=60.62 TRINITY_DN2827_c0_g1_i5:1126-2727(+)